MNSDVNNLHCTNIRNCLNKAKWLGSSYLCIGRPSILEIVLGIYGTEKQVNIPCTELNKTF